MLTPRQMEVAELVAQGKSAKAIARELGLAVQTVHDHIHSAAQRLPVYGRPRHRLTVWVFQLSDEDSECA